MAQVAPEATLAVAAPLLPISGVDGYIALIQGASTPTPAAPFSNILTMPGGARAYPVGQAYTITDRTKKIGDSRVPPVVYVDGSSVPPTNYRFFPGGQYIIFFTPLAPAAVVTADVSSLSTATATDVYGLLHVNNWQLNLTSNPIPGDEYGTLMTPQYRGKMAGTWQFDRYSSQTSVDLYYLMMQQSYFTFALYESLLQNRMWIIYGDIGANPMQAPAAGMVGGTITGTLVAQPSMIVEHL